MFHPFCKWLIDFLSNYNLVAICFDLSIQKQLSQHKFRWHVFVFFNKGHSFVFDLVHLSCFFLSIWGVHSDFNELFKEFFTRIFFFNPIHRFFICGIIQRAWKLFEGVFICLTSNEEVVTNLGSGVVSWVIKTDSKLMTFSLKLLTDQSKSCLFSSLFEDFDSMSMKLKHWPLVWAIWFHSGEVPSSKFVNVDDTVFIDIKVFESSLKLIIIELISKFLRKLF